MTAIVMERLALRVPEAAEAIGVSRAKLYEIIQRGDLKTVRIDGSVRVLADELKRYVQALAS